MAGKQRNPPAKTENDAISAYLAQHGLKNPKLDELPSVSALTGHSYLDPFEMVGPGGVPVPAGSGRWSRVDTSSDSASMDAEELRRKGFDEVTDARFHMRGLPGELRGRIFHRPPEFEREAMRQEHARAHRKFGGQAQTQTNGKAIDVGGGRVGTATETVTSTTTAGQDW